MTAAPLSLRHMLYAVAVVFIWGTNFVVIKYAVGHLPPLLLGCLRFSLVTFPAIFFLKRPEIAWSNLAAYGVLIGAGQFGMVYMAVDGHISPGLASLVVQTQVFITIGLSMLLTGERLKLFQIPALLLAVAGIVVIGLHTDATTTVLGIGMILIAATAWAAGNIVGKRAGSINMLAYVVWSSPFAAVSLGALTLLFEGPSAIMAGLKAADSVTWAAVLWQSVGNSLFGYAVWAWLLSKYPASTITPMALLVPVFGMGAASLVLHEPMPAWKLMAALMVIGGLALNLLWPRLLLKLNARSATL